MIQIRSLHVWGIFLPVGRGSAWDWSEAADRL